MIILSGNLAQGKTAKQSSTYQDFVASRAVDGSANKYNAGKSCTHTEKDAGAWWEVDLGAESKLQKVIITNRGDYCYYCRKYLSVDVENGYFLM